MVNIITDYSYLKSFIYNEGEMHLAEISKKLGLPHPTTRIYLNKFESLGILKKRIKGRQTFYAINKDSPLLIDVLSIVEKEVIFNRMIKDSFLRELVELINRNISYCPIIIFGSFCLDSKKAEDIDILVIGETNKKAFSEIEKKMGKPIQLINLKNFSEVKDSLKQEIKKKHLIVSNVEDCVKWLV